MMNFYLEIRRSFFKQILKNQRSVETRTEQKIISMLGKASFVQQRSPFSRTLLIITYNFPHYDSIGLLHEFYDPVFQKVIVCGSQNHENVEIVVEHIEGFFAYHCAAKAMEIYPDYKGMIFFQFVTSESDHF